MKPLQMMILCVTNKEAPRYKLVPEDLKEPTTQTYVLHEAEKDVLKL